MRLRTLPVIHLLVLLALPVAVLCTGCAPTAPTREEVVSRLAADPETIAVRETLRLTADQYRAYLSCSAEAIVDLSTPDQARRYVDGRATLRDTPHRWPQDRMRTCLADRGATTNDPVLPGSPTRTPSGVR